jgi:hypothetical protein
MDDAKAEKILKRIEVVVSVKQCRSLTQTARCVSIARL